MRIFNEDKTKEIEKYDERFYRVRPDKILVTHHEAEPEIEEQSHFEVIKEYPNGGKDVDIIIDVPHQPAKEAYDEYEDILVLVPYTQEELNNNRIAELKQNLANTDYQAIKYAEGELIAEEYEPMKQQRKLWREEINRLGG